MVPGASEIEVDDGCEDEDAALICTAADRSVVAATLDVFDSNKPRCFIWESATSLPSAPTSIVRWA